MINQVKRITKYAIQLFGSPKLMTLLFFILICSLAIGTFLDAGAIKSPSTFTDSIIFKSKWLELVIVLLALNFIINIHKYRLIQRKMWSILLLHFAFILIILGAGITRYFGYEGIVNIRENSSANSFYSYDTYINMYVDGIINNQARRKVFKPKQVRLSERLKNDVEITSKFGENQFQLKILDFKEKASVQKNVVPTTSGINHLMLIENSNNNRNEYFIKENNSLRIKNSIIAFNTQGQNSTIEITQNIMGVFLKSSKLGFVQNMVTQELDSILPGSLYKLSYLKLYHFGDLTFVVPKKPIKGLLKEVLVKDVNSLYDGVQMEISLGDDKQLVNLLGRAGEKPKYKRVDIGGLFVHLAYGSKKYDFPFSIRLDDFIAERYPGREKIYKAFKSKITVEDQKSFKYDIYMNETLNYKGYRLFQASFDEDEKGTYLSVNHDLAGTIVSYAGYVLLFTALILLLFDGKSRFSSLKKSLSKLNSKPLVLLLIFSCLFFGNAYGTNVSESNSDSIYQKIEKKAIDKTTASAFGKLIVQDDRGRMKPINTYGAELLRKISRRDKFNQLNSDQIVFSFIQFPEEWVKIELIKLKHGNDSIRKILNLALNKKYASLNDFYNEDRTLKLPPKLVQKASKGFNPNKFEKDILRAFEDQYLLGRALNGDVFRIFPIPNHPQNKWVSYHELSNLELEYANDEFNNIVKLIFEDKNLNQDIHDQFILTLVEIQQKYGGKIIPSKAKVDFEILYNQLNIFQRLFLWNLLAGLSLILFSILNLFWKNNRISVIIDIHRWIIYSLFLLFLTGLVSRWYISGHAPWSDAYESMIYVAFIALLFGVIFSKKSSLTLAATCFVSSMILMVAHWNFIDPAITNLVPVLDSYWLMIHVAIIVASYGPFTLSMTLGLVTLVISVFVNAKNIKNIKPAINELTTINEMSMTIGLIMLTIGNFLGAMWANESWGRYWAWDPKETWALISILIYAFILHMRLIPGLKSKLTLSLASVLAYSSILMTYFGVNFYLTGLHSYASGGKVIGISNLWIIVASLAVIYYISYVKNRKYGFI